MKLQELEKKFEEEFKMTINVFSENYPRMLRGKINKDLSEETAKLVTGNILLSILREIQIDCNKMIFRDFMFKYAKNLPVLDVSDFTSNDDKTIIELSHLCERDKKIAYKHYVEGKKF